MAQLKDTVISGSLRVTDTTYTTTADVSFIKASTAAGAAAHGTGSAGQVLHSDGVSPAYWGALTSTEIPTIPGSKVSGTVSSATSASNAASLGGSAASTYLQGDDVKAGSGITVTTAAGVATVSADLRTTTKLGAAGATAAATETTKIYAVQMDSNGDLAVKVPWTDTDTKVTAVGNHYTPSSSGTFSPAAGGTTTDISTSVVNIITGLQKDAAGHITGVVSGSIKATNTPNTDEKQAMSPNITTKYYPTGSTVASASTAASIFSTAVSITGSTVSGGTFSGNMVHANVANSGAAGGISLYDTEPTNYGITMRQTSNSGKHGGVQGDWAIYTYMAGATNRGFIWKHSGTAVASIDCAGNEVLNGSLTVGGSSANNTGCKLQFNSTTKSLDFIFA